MSTELMPLVEPNADLTLAMLAGEINQLNEVVTEYAGKAIIGAARLGDKLRQATKYTTGFDAWLAANCPRVKRSQAYNYMKIAHEMPELLDETVQITGHLLNQSQAIALFSAPEELKEQIKERIENGETVPVAEINDLKRQLKQSESTIKSIAHDRDNLREKKVALADEVEALKKASEALKDKAGIDDLVNKAVEAKKILMQQELDALVAEQDRENGNQRDALNDKIMKLQNDLAKARKPSAMTELTSEIDSARQELEQMKARVNRGNIDLEYRNIASHLIEQSATLTVSLLGIKAVTATKKETVALLEKAATDLTTLVQLLKNAVTTTPFFFPDE